jgi:amino acid adenylation domain-containing protein/non-ribosomal peptide synthase protein (TIGR01720 family)
MPQEIIEGFRLSPPQKHLWLLQSDQSPAYRARCMVRIEGALIAELLEQAIRHVIGQHEILRTAFKLLPGMTIPVQVITERTEFSLDRHDATQLSVADQQAKIESRFADAARRAIDWEDCPTLDGDLIALSSDQNILIISAPAVCADALSLQNFIRQTAAAYAAYSRSEEPASTEAMQYADFAEWQNELLEAEEAAVAKQYWKQHNGIVAADQKFSFERRNASTEPFQPVEELIEVAAATRARIKAVTDRSDASVSSFLLACWQILIARLTGRSEIVVGTAIDGRKFAELKDAVGLFSTFVPLKSDLSDDLPFEKLLTQITEQQREAQRWQEYFAGDDAASSIEETTPRFFPFCFETRQQVEQCVVADLTFSICQQDACTDRFKVKLVCENGGAQLQYDSTLFSPDDVRHLGDQLITLIEDASKRPEVTLGELEVVSDAERHRLVVEFNDTERTYPEDDCIHGLFEHQAEQRPNQIAVVFEAERLTFRELNACANQLAHHLRKLGVGPDVPVGLCLDRSLDLIIGLLGIIKAGGAYVPLDPGLPSARLGMILEDAGARMLITKSALAESLRDRVEQVVCLDADRDAIANESRQNPSRSVIDQNLVYVIFTSGSTGRPKGVAVEHRQLVNYVNAIWEKLDLPVGCSFATVSTIAADLGNTAVFPALCKGGTLHLISEERASDADALAEYFSRNEIDCLKIVPSHLSALLSASNPAAIVPRRRLVLGGEACPWSLVEKVAMLSPGCVIFNHYGPTEATVGAISDRADIAEMRIADTVPLGHPIANVRAYVLDRRIRPVPIGAAGELHIGGAGLARGYINRAGATAEKFVPSPFGNGERLYQTGDLARYLSDGRIEFLGRVDDQVKIHGFRIEPAEIEIALRNHADVGECVVVAREDQPGDRRLVAYVVMRNGEKAGARELRAFLNGRLPEYMTPSAFVFLARLPLTPNGKIDRRALPAPDQSRADGGRLFTGPRNHIEETLAKIWSNILGVDRVGVHDNFFDLGGDSILSIQIIARANQAGLGLSPRQLFQHQTVAELAAVAGISAAPVAEQGTVIGSVQLTPVQTRFFELDQPEPHHYNQAVLLEFNGELHASSLASAVEKLLLHHDALRLRFARDEQGWQQTIATPDGDVPFETIDLSRLSGAEQSAAIADHATRIHASLNLEKGPLVRVALFNRGVGANAYLLIVIHHLAVDGVSWRIILEDLQTLLQNNTKEPSLPPKTTSFKTWAERLTEHARSGALNAELSYWLTIGERPAAQLPRDHQNETNTAASARTLTVSLGGDETRALLQEVPVAFRTQINEVLLTALARAFASWTGSSSLLLDLEGHGREEIIEGVDLSRTVGWFTTVFPVVLDLGAPQAPVDALRAVKEQLRAIPERGIGYGLLRYASGDAAIAEKLRALPQAEVRFNYLGQVDRTLPDAGFFHVTPESSGPAQSPKAERAHLLNIIGSVSRGELRLEWTYSENIHRRETIERLAQSYLEELRALIARARSGAEASYLPSDFPSAKLSQEDLNKVLAKLRG